MKYNLWNYMRKGKETNLKELPRPCQLAQSPSAECIHDRIEVGKASMAPVHIPSLIEITEES